MDESPPREQPVKKRPSGKRKTAAEREAMALAAAEAAASAGRGVCSGGKKRPRELFPDGDVSSPSARPQPRLVEQSWARPIWLVARVGLGRRQQRAWRKTGA